MRRILTALAALAIAGAAQAQDYPTRPDTRWSCRSPPAASPMPAAACIAKALSSQPWPAGRSSRTRPGPAASSAAEFVANAKPDGYTLLVASNGVARDLSVPVQEALVSIRRRISRRCTASRISPLMVAVRSDAPYKTLHGTDRLREKKSREDQFRFGGARVIAHHMLAELLQKEAGIKMTHHSLQGSFRRRSPISSAASST